MPMPPREAVELITRYQTVTTSAVHTTRDADTRWSVTERGTLTLAMQHGFDVLS